MAGSSGSRWTWRPGLPGFSIVGLADTALQEARERVRGAIRNSGFTYPPRRITVNLAPADLPKRGASLDLGIAAAILLGSEQVRAAGRWALVGELSLGGEVRPVPGLLPMVAALARRGVRRVIVPADALAEARLVGGIETIGAANLGEAMRILRSTASRRRLPAIAARVEAAAGPAGRSRRAGSPLEPGPRHPGPRGRARPARGAARARDRARRRPRPAAHRAAGRGQDPAGPDDPGPAAAARDAEALAATIVDSAAPNAR